MKMTKMIYNSPNYANAQKLAYETIQNSNQKKLPLSIKKLIRSFPNLHIQKYTTFSRKKNLTLNEVCDLLDSEEGCLWMREDETYIILYNDTIKNSGRIRFTLAHELGHYILKHNEKNEKTILTRYSLSNEEYDVFEKEANYFAKRLLAPIPLVDLYVANWKKIKASCVEFAFDTSFTLANYVIKDLNKREKNAHIIREGHPMVDYFVDFINSDTNSKICSTCSSIQPIEYNNCVVCGNDTFIESSVENYPNYYVMKGKAMNYSKIETNENKRPLKCPRCEYENLDDDFSYCPICSLYLVNKCLGDDFDNPYGEQIPLHYQQQNACEGSLDGSFRYCPNCGSQTSYLYQQLLNTWDIEKIESEKEKLPF